MDSTLTAVLPPARCTPAMQEQLWALTLRSGILDIEALIRIAVERLIAQEKQPCGWITLGTLDRLRALAPEVSRALGKPVGTDEEVLCALLDHWQRTKVDCYGKTPFAKGMAPPPQ